MNLTLEVEDDFPEVYATAIRSSLPIHELAYYVNYYNKINLVKERPALQIKRRNQQAHFNWFSLENEDGFSSFLHLISNLAFYKKERVAEINLFSVDDPVEERMILLPSIRKFDFWFLHPNQNIDQVDLNHLISKSVIQTYQLKSVGSFKKAEQHLIENIYYEKQN